MARQIQAFADSEFVFQRSSSLIPFPPLAFVGTKHYSDAEVTSSSRGVELNYGLTSVSQAAAIPLLLTERDAIVIGEYLNWSSFRIRDDAAEDFNVATIGLPIGWIRQIDPQWQVAAFVMPMGHKSTAEDADWTWQTMGGAFWRYVQNDRLWWAFGAYFDAAPGDDFYIPYLGASWTINDHWTLSAIMPWPAVLYAPNDDWLFRLGLAPSGASWSAYPPGEDHAVVMNLDAWDFGLSVERRLFGGYHAGLEVGVGGFRGLRFDDAGLEGIDIDAGTSAYFALEFNFRPGEF